MSEEQPTKPKRTLTDDDVKVERVQTVRTRTAIQGATPGPHPDDPDRRAGTPATDHDA